MLSLSQGELSADLHAERVLLSRARQGDLDALRGLVHRYASLVWAVCAQIAEEEAAARRFAECWETVLSSLSRARRSPDLAGMILRYCYECLRDEGSEERLSRAIASAQELAADSRSVVEVPEAALLAVVQRLCVHSERLQKETADRRSARRRWLLSAIGIAIALVGGIGAAYEAASRPLPSDVVARSLRSRIVSSDLVPRFRDVVTPPFEAVERQPPEARRYEEIGLVLEELANVPTDVRAQELTRLKRRVEILDLVDFASREAEMLRGANAIVMQEVCLVLEELTNL